MKTFLAILLGKTIFFLSRILKLGGGFAAPGLYALKIEPNLASKLASQIPTQIIITGTNGKTTAAGLLAHLYKHTGVKVLRNQTGSNLERGIVSTLIKHSSLFGGVKEQVAIWEVDEAAFNILAPKLKPNLIVFLNVFRDQLDRYGEVDKVVSNWVLTLKKLPQSTGLLINGDDGSLEKLKQAKQNKEYFSVPEVEIIGEKKRSNESKARFQSVKVKNDFGKISFTFLLDDCKIPISIPIPGNFNIVNATAALSAKFLNGGLAESEAMSLKDFTASFGRFEKFRSEEKEGFLLLIKNPVGATEVLSTVLPHVKPNDQLLVVLNDNLADGTDVSWIWDISLEKFRIQNSKFKIFVSGSRVYDLALRLKYAGVDQKRMVIEPNLQEAFDKALKGSGSLFVLPTYTAMLALQKLLVKRGIKKEYWRE